MEYWSHGVMEGCKCRDLYTLQLLNKTGIIRGIRCKNGLQVEVRGAQQSGVLF